MAQESPILKGQFRTFLSWTWFWPCRTFFQIKIHTSDLVFIPGAILLSPELSSEYSD